MNSGDRVYQLLSTVKALAQEYRELTGKPLGITGEVAEFEASRILGVQLTPARQAGYDAVERRDGHMRRLHIKGRCIPSGASRSQMASTKQRGTLCLPLSPCQVQKQETNVTR
jgi:hypothetical protein